MTSSTRPATQNGVSPVAATKADPIAINRSREELYAFWRDFRNLPGSVIAWASVEGSSVRNSGQVEFLDAAR